MPLIPTLLPAIHPPPRDGSQSALDIDTGGYDFTIGGVGFRLATNQSFPYKRYTEPTTTQKFNTSKEPGAQSLSALPWTASQSTFHAGAGQLNLESPGNIDAIAPLRFDTSLGVDVWTPGKVSRLPDTKLTSFGVAALSSCTGAVNGVDYAIVGTAAGLYQLKWLTGPDGTATSTAINLSGAAFGGSANCSIVSMCTDGATWYALLQLAATTSGNRTLVISGAFDSTSAPTVLYVSATVLTGIVGWSKERLLAGLANKFYELDVTATSAALPTAKYSHPSSGWAWTAISEAPQAIVAAGKAGQQSSILGFTLDSTGGTPVLAGGTTVGSLPTGEQVTCLAAALGSFLIIGTNKGVRVATFETFTGAMRYGPLSLVSTAPVYALTGRDRFVFAGWSNQQADGSTGLARIDLSMVVDQAGRLGWAPDIRPPSTAPTGVGTVTSVGTLALSGRLIFLAADGIHVEGNGPGSDGEAWLRTSRIRYDTSEMKLFKLGSVHGSLDTSTITILGTVPFHPESLLGTFGFVINENPGEFRLVAGQNEWLQLRFVLNGSSCVFNSYQVKALPSPHRQELIELTANCFRAEVDRQGEDVTDPQFPRDRFNAVRAIEQSGSEVRFVEFTNNGSVAQLVVIDEIAFTAFDRPNIEDDFGGYISFKLRTTES